MKLLDKLKGKRQAEIEEPSRDEVQRLVEENTRAQEQLLAALKRLSAVTTAIARE